MTGIVVAVGAHIDPKYIITGITIVIKSRRPIRFDISPQILGHMPCALLLAPGRYCRHCGSRSAAEMGGDMRSVGSHLGATVVPVSLRQGAARTVGGNPRRQKCKTEMWETVTGESRTGHRH